MPLHLIMALSDNDVIGVGSKLPWRIAFDLKWFKMNTYGSACIMGRKTWESLPSRPLEGRLNIVLSRHAYDCEGCIFRPSLASALDLAQRHSVNVYIIGGSEIFTQSLLLKMVDSVILTRVHTKIHARNAIYATLPLYKTLKWKSKRFQRQNLSFHFEIYKIKNI